MAVDTGLGATLTANPSSWSGSTISYQLHTSTLGGVNISHLGTTTFEDTMAADLAEPGEVTLTLQFDDKAAPPVVGDAGTLTLTDAVAPSDSVACNYSGSAIVRSVSHGSRSIDELKTLEVVIAWDGVTGPTFTVGS